MFHQHGVPVLGCSGQTVPNWEVGTRFPFAQIPLGGASFLPFVA